MNDYLRQIGLGDLTDELLRIKINSFVAESFSESFFKLPAREIEKLYLYDVPKINDDGICNLTSEKDEEPCNLAFALGLTGDLVSLTLRIRRLYSVVNKVMKFIGPDWFGIYQKTVNHNGELILIKEAYASGFSRAEFPLNEKFAAQSNNATVGLTGKARYFDDLLSNYDSPY